MPQDTLVQDIVSKLQVLSKRIDDAFANISGVNSNTREILSTARTYYVRTDGSDVNDGLTNTAVGAFLTPQKAIDVISGTLDMSIYDVTIQIADGTYSGNVVPNSCVGTGAVIVQGNVGTPTNVILTCSSGLLIGSTNVKTTYKLLGFQMTGTGTASIAISVSNGSYVQYENVDFGSGFVNFHVSVVDLGSVAVTGNYTISGGCVTHWAIQVGAFRCQSRTITLTGTPAFTQFASASRSGCTLIVNSNTFSGSATGKRYTINLNAVLDAASAAETYLPGNALGSVSSGGRYGQFEGRSRVSAQFDKANTTLADITGLTSTLLAGRTYKFSVILYTTSNIASGVKAAMAGTCTATAIIYEALVIQLGAAVAPGTSRATTLGTAVANVTAVTAATIIIEGTITVNAAGTLTCQFADNAGTNTSSVLVGSNMIVEDITP